MVNEELDVLFNEWKAQMETDGHKNFCADGLIRQLGKEELTWMNAERKVVFLLKEPFNKELHDIRDWSGKMEDMNIPDLFYSRIAAWLYGIQKATSTEYPSLETAFFSKIQLKSLRTYPHAFVNIKKSAPEARTYDSEIYNMGMKYKDFLKEQLEILEGNIVVCCGPITFRVAQEVIYDNRLTEINDWVYVDTRTKTLFINAFEPTASKNNRQMYDWMMEKLIQVL
ncbi:MULTISPECIES: hypothetical protein [Bacteroides]|uniref:hypothetical protein n=1 Tax=Bacteroides TaxID=816 RepID=UPI001DE6AEC5|nr:MULTISPECIES: hypothetical protein [Bacteroides]HJD91507.1 hypothetical protein [Bacteroides coprosuis]